MYQALDDRPGMCEGCQASDFPSQYGPSTKQITWNAVEMLWLCVECQYQWSKWMGSAYSSEAARVSCKPSFLILVDRERAKGD
jgi:hypothetical protein